MLFLGIDIGSSGCKASVVNIEGEILCSAKREYEIVTLQNGYRELDGELVFGKVLEALVEISHKCDLKDLATISTTSFGEMVVPVDENAKPVARAISYDDPRGWDEINQLLENISEDRVYDITGAKADPMFSLAKIMWLKKNQHEVYKSTYRFCAFADYILIRLGAAFHTDYSLASRTLLFDPVKCEWSEEIIKASGVDKDKLSKAVIIGTEVGTLCADLASQLGANNEVKLLAGSHDQIAAALGAGILCESEALAGLGSNECYVPVFKRPLKNATMRESNLVCVPHAIGGMYATYAFCRSSGSLMKWYNDVVGDAYIDLNDQQVPAEPTKIFVLPHFAGAATPYMDDSSKGAIVGLTLSTKKQELTKAFVEGINYEMMINLDCLKRAGFEVKVLKAVGGQTKNRSALQLKADMLGVEIRTLRVSEAGVLGAAILGCVACKVFESYEQAVEKLVSVEEVFVPNMQRHKEYAPLFEQYKKLYGAVKNFYNGSEN